ncbi:MAG: terminase small subunit [Pseudomonadota bacterium]
MPELCVSSKEMAVILGISDRKVRDLAANGLLTRTAPGKYAVDSIALYAEHLRKIAAGRGNESFDLTAERARLTAAQADKAALQAATLRGEMVPVDAVTAEWSHICHAIRAAVMAVPSRVRQQLPHISAADAAVVDGEIRLALIELADDGDRNAA